MGKIAMLPPKGASTTGQGVLAWTNSDTSQDMDIQDITLSEDIDDYNFFEIVFLKNKTGTATKEIIGTYSTGKLPISHDSSDQAVCTFFLESTMIMVSAPTTGYLIVCQRGGQLRKSSTTNSVHLGSTTILNTSTGDSVTNNSFIIPYLIYFYK